MFELRSIIRIFCALFELLISQPVLTQNTDAEIKEQAILDSLVEYIFNQEWGSQPYCQQQLRKRKID